MHGFIKRFANGCLLPGGSADFGQEHLAGVEDYILAEAVWREAIARWPGATPMQDDRGGYGREGKVWVFSLW